MSYCEPEWYTCNMLSLLKNSIVIDVMKNNHNCDAHMTRIRAVCISWKPTSIVQCAQPSSNILPTLRCHILITYKQENSSRAEPSKYGAHMRLRGANAKPAEDNTQPRRAEGGDFSTNRDYNISIAHGHYHTRMNAHLWL